jgi:hypothetical protein
MLEFLHYPPPTADGWSSFPVVRDWHDLLKPEQYPYNNGSSSNQPACELSSQACSSAMYCADLCFWHRYRMGGARAGCLSLRYLSR